MVEIRHILCPIDFSDTSRHALEHAVAIATWYESQLTALHVIHPGFLYPPPILFAELPRHSLPTEPERQSLDEQLRAWLEPARRAGVKTNVLFDDGDPAARILDRAKALACDLIVIGTHGLGGFERFMLGSVAEKVLRKAPCPVMTVPPAAVTTGKVPVRAVAVSGRLLGILARGPEVRLLARQGVGRATDDSSCVRLARG